MADKKSSGFRFRLPWLLQPAPTPSPVDAPEPPTQQPRTTIQTSEPSTQPPRSTTQTFVASTSAQRPPFRPPGKAPTTPASPRRSPPQSVTSPPTPTVSPKSSPPKSPIAKTIEPVSTQPTKESQTIETTGPLTPPQRTPLGPPKQAQSPPSPPQTTSPPKSNAQLHETTPPQPSQIRTPPRSPPPSVSQSTSPLRSLSTKRATEIITEEKYPIKSNNLVPQDDDDLAFNAKPRDIPKPKVVQTKSQKPKPITTSQVPLQKEIKDNISKLINKISSISSPNQHTNEKQTSVITLAGDNKGASMHLTADHANKRDSKVDKNQETEAIVNSNVQGINNSIMFDSSVTERNPGVHLRLSHDLPNINDSDVNDEDSMQMQRAEVNITPPQKLVYNPAFGIDDIETSANGQEIEVL